MTSSIKNPLHSMYGDESPTDKDRKEGQKLFNQDGRMDLVRLAAEVAMGRRHSVKHHHKINEMETAQVKKDAESKEMYTAIIGNEELGIMGVICKLDKIDSDQTQVYEALAKSNSKQNYIAGIGACLLVVVPIIIMLIMAARAAG